MKIQIVHNPTAGNADHNKKDLLEHLEPKFDKVNYISTIEPGWNNFLKDEPDVIFLGGGDGTFGKLAETLLNAGAEKQKIPVALLPLGTANNIAKSLGLKKGADSNFSLSGKTKNNFDVAHVEIGDENKNIFEGVGFGIFPRLVAEMEKNKNKSNDPEDELRRSHEVLLNLVREYEPKQAQFQFEGQTLQGTYLLVEFINIKYIGPNFELAPNGASGDGKFDLVTVAEDKREELVEYLEQITKGNTYGKDLSEIADIRRVSEIRMKWEGKDVHLDDDLLSDYKGEFCKVKVKPGALQVFAAD